VTFDTGGVPVSPASTPSDEAVYGPDGIPFVKAGVIRSGCRARFGPFRLDSPVRVIYVIDEKNRKGFACGTLPGHPISGEEAFIVDTEPDGSVWLTLRVRCGARRRCGGHRVPRARRRCSG
jgi:uncharacterized protein (UPF0548 family)